MDFNPTVENLRRLRERVTEEIQPIRNSLPTSGPLAATSEVRLTIAEFSEGVESTIALAGLLLPSLANIRFQSEVNGGSNAYLPDSR